MSGIFCLSRYEGTAAEAACLRPDEMANLSFRALKKVYDKEVVAVHDFSLEVEDKEFIVLVGPSGCGKSTTLRMVAGLEEITEGELYIGDRLVNHVQPKDRDIAMVFQNYSLYPHMTVYDNIAFSLKLRKVPKSEIDKKVREAAEILDITEYLQRKPKALSGGQRQRVAIGRAIVRDPAVFLMDEPLSNLDAKLRNQMRTEIIKLRKRIDTTFLYVTHDQTEAMTLGDRIVIMKDGFIMQVGSPQQVFDQPENLFVAGFIGTPQMNFFRGELFREEEGYRLRCAGCDVPLSPERQALLRQRGVGPGPVTIGIRPDYIELTESGGLPVEVEMSEVMGSSVHVHANLDGADAVVIVPTTDLPDQRVKGFLAGQPLRLHFLPEQIHLFDIATEKSLLFGTMPESETRDIAE